MSCICFVFEWLFPTSSESILKGFCRIIHLLKAFIDCFISTTFFKLCHSQSGPILSGTMYSSQRFNRQIRSVVWRQWLTLRTSRICTLTQNVNVKWNWYTPKSKSTESITAFFILVMTSAVERFQVKTLLWPADTALKREFQSWSCFRGMKKL